MAVDLAQDSVSSAAQDAKALRHVFEAINAESCPHSFNFHIHTVFSDGRLQPEQVIEQAISLGLRGLTITDHHGVNGYRKAQHWLEQWQQQHPNQAAPQFWTGIEINAELVGVEVHILGYAFDPDHHSLLPYLTGQAATGRAYQATEVIAALHAAKGLAVLAHPSRYKRSSTELISAAATIGIDGIETYYAYNNPFPWQPSPLQTQAAFELGKRYGLLNTCGTDTHGLSLLQRL